METEDQPRLYCPECKKGNQSPCEKCNHHWDYKDGIIPLDETFEIISLKEKFWREKLLEAEAGYISAESNLMIFDKVIKIAREEVDKEAKKNAR